MRILNWNIRSGGGKNIDRIVERIEVHSPDVVVLTEFRNLNSAALIDKLTECGFGSIETSRPIDKQNGILVASRLAFILDDSNTQVGDPQRWLPLYFPETGIHLIALHVPGADDHKFTDGVGISGPARKKAFWEKIISVARGPANDSLILVGDFNTGLKKDSQGTPFTMHSYMTDLMNLGLVDVWRLLHFDELEFTWFSQRKVDGVTRDFNGFRLDYIFVSRSLSTRIISAFHSHEERTSGISDHSALICDVEVEGLKDEIAAARKLANAEGRFKWALAVLNDPDANADDKARAQPIVDAQQRVWDQVDARLDQIMEIDDDDERERAWDAW